MINSNGKLFIYISFCFFLAPLLAVAGIRDTKHNLSVSGPGPAVAEQETQICIFCHTPHNANPGYPLWNHELSAIENYINYWSPTLQSYSLQQEAPPIDGFSKLCLGCHDGTVALGAVIGPKGQIETVPEFLTEGMPGYLGTDLSGGHPISIVYNESLVIQRNTTTDLLHLNWPIRKLGERVPVGDPDVIIYPTQGDYGVQCTSCHDPHGGKGGLDAPPMWRKTTYDEVCLVCHTL